MESTNTVTVPSSVYDLNELKTILDNAVYNVLKIVSSEYNINFEELKAKFNSSSVSLPPSSKEDKKIKKGRKKKNSEFVEMTKFIYENKEYLVDNENNVYTFDIEKPKLIGQKLVNGIVKFNNSLDQN
jgi:hypothetical protein